MKKKAGVGKRTERRRGRSLRRRKIKRVRSRRRTGR
jgi:hypothetical protein